MEQLEQIRRFSLARLLCDNTDQIKTIQVRESPTLVENKGVIREEKIIYLVQFCWEGGRGGGSSKIFLLLPKERQKGEKTKRQRRKQHFYNENHCHPDDLLMEGECLNINGKFISKHFVVTAIAPKTKIKHEKLRKSRDPSLLFKEGRGGEWQCVQSTRIQVVFSVHYSLSPDSSTSVTRSKAQSQSFVPW